MDLISIEFCFITLLILLIFIINISQILYIIICQNEKSNRFFHSILLNSSFSSLIVAIWLIPFFYFRTIWSSESISWRIWSFIFHIIDAVQLYSLLLLLITNSNPINRSFQRFFLSLTWLAPILTYSPLLWLSSSSDDQIDYLPYRRLTLDVPWWILPIVYSCMYLIPIFLSLTLIGMTICWPWIYKEYQKRKNSPQRQLNEHRENMAELTSLIETVLNFELDQSTMNTWIPSISPSSPTDHTSLSYISNKLTRSLSYKASQDRSSFLFDELLSSSSSDKEEFQVNYYFLLVITCLLLIIHSPYVLFALLNIYMSQLPIFIYIHWFGTMFIPIIQLQKH